MTDAAEHARPLPPHPALRRPLHGAGVVVRAVPAADRARASWRRAGRAARLEHIAQRFHVLAVELGGLMIKVGQFMSSRLDVLPPEITKELEGLQDEVPPVPFDGDPPRSPRPSSACRSSARSPRSIRCRWPRHPSVKRTARGSPPIDAADTGLGDVVVKIQRPGIEAIVDVDLSALRRVAGWLSRVRVVADHVDLPALVEEFAHTSLEEIDYLHEAANAERFADDFAGDARVRRARGRLGAHDAARADARRTSRRSRSTTSTRCAPPASTRPRSPREFAAVMFDQLFSHGFFHADPHPGNIFVTPVQPRTGRGRPRRGSSRSSTSA